MTFEQELEYYDDVNVTSKLWVCAHRSETAVRLRLHMGGMEVLATFLSEAKASCFYDVPLVDVTAGLRFRCELEPH